MRAGRALREKWAADARWSAYQLTPAEVAAMIAHDRRRSRFAQLYGSLCRAAYKSGAITIERAFELAGEMQDGIYRRYPPALDVVLRQREATR